MLVSNRQVESNLNKMRPVEKGNS
jgi:hypothetical protein